MGAKTLTFIKILATFFNVQGAFAVVNKTSLFNESVLMSVENELDKTILKVNTKNSTFDFYRDYDKLLKTQHLQDILKGILNAIEKRKIPGGIAINFHLSPKLRHQTSSKLSSAHLPDYNTTQQLNYYSNSSKKTIKSLSVRNTTGPLIKIFTGPLLTSTFIKTPFINLSTNYVSRTTTIFTNSMATSLATSATLATSSTTSTTLANFTNPTTTIPYISFSTTFMSPTTNLVSSIKKTFMNSSVTTFTKLLSKHTTLLNLEKKKNAQLVFATKSFSYDNQFSSAIKKSKKKSTKNAFTISTPSGTLQQISNTLQSISNTLQSISVTLKSISNTRQPFSNTLKLIFKTEQPFLTVSNQTTLANKRMSTNTFNLNVNNNQSKMLKTKNELKSFVLLNLTKNQYENNTETHIVSNSMKSSKDNAVKPSNFVLLITLFTLIVNLKNFIS
ncbi:uncharacterized protein LOC124815520 isoform X2 [Hydra vulgaris]|uniref:Uncharacterized protein LOC124815520 isoform X2 n=1 Tax=Hydra vulgaris TaxID=6087 RepID=A0ABM4D9N2_HYDVU